MILYIHFYTFITLTGMLVKIFQASSIGPSTESTHFLRPNWPQRAIGQIVSAAMFESLLLESHLRAVRGSIFF